MLEKEILVAPRLVLLVRSRPPDGARKRRAAPRGTGSRRDRRRAGAHRASASGPRRRRTTPCWSRRSACSCAPSARADSRDGRSPRARTPRSADRPRRRESAWRIPARKSRGRSRRARPSSRTAGRAASPCARRRPARRSDRRGSTAPARSVPARRPRRPCVSGGHSASSASIAAIRLSCSASNHSRARACRAFVSSMSIFQGAAQGERKIWLLPRPS